MSVAGKREGITRADFIATGRQFGVATVPRLNAVIDPVSAALAQWPGCAATAGVSANNTARIGQVLAEQPVQENTRAPRKRRFGHGRDLRG